MSKGSYRILRCIRVALSLALLMLVTVAVAAGWSCFACRWQLVPSLLACSVAWLVLWVGVTAVFGRIYCSSACPMGTFQDILIRLSPRRRKGFFYSPGRPAVQWGVLVFAILAALFGATLVVGLLDPYSAWCRITLAAKELPLLVQGVGISVVSAIVAAATIVVAAWASLLHGRLLCNTVCPAGTLLASLARYSLLHPDINTDKCTGCGDCERVCKAECIDLNSHVVDIARCVVCFDCMAVCPADAITYRTGRFALQTPLMQTVGGSSTPTAMDQQAAPKPVDRRAFIASLVSAGAIVASGTARKAALVPVNRVLPPGRTSDAVFDIRCTGCGACASACPTGAIRLSALQPGLRHAMQPVLDFDAGPCRFDCNRCTQVCAPAALSPLTIAEKHRFVIGKVRIDPTMCIVFETGEHCGLCVRRCPLSALKMEATSYTFANGTSRRAPHPNYSACIGCGECQWVCPASPKAIVIEGD